ncbi:Glycosyltransferase involved in cell wall bisynthesis [Frankineae bacterium MT45]|nr:Glycosyltransferase involved in cell wall bisynthesis [Frankineae bacterium MT45]
MANGDGVLGWARSAARSALLRIERLRPAIEVQGWERPLIGPPGPVPPMQSVVRPQSDDGPKALPPAVREAMQAAAQRPAIRCLLVTSGIDAGGMDEVVAFLARRLRDFNFETAVLRTTDTPAPDGVSTGRLARMLQSEGITVLDHSAATAVAWMRDWDPAVISGHGQPDWAVAAAAELGVPCVDTLHGMHTLFGVDWAAERVRASSLARIVSVSELVRQQYLAGNPAYPSDHIVTIPNAVDDQRRPRYERAVARQALGLTDEYVLVSLARHCLQKNTYGLVGAFGDFARTRPQAHLVIAGRVEDDRYFRRVTRLRDSLPCRDRVHLRDHAPDPALLLAAADGFVLDAFFEGWALAPMEALFMGLPVVTSDVGGAREQIADDPARGVVVANPLGDPLAADWPSIARARYADQPNRAEFVAAMELLYAGRETYRANRASLAAESGLRFDAGTCIAEHAALLSELAGIAQHEELS